MSMPSLAAQRRKAARDPLGAEADVFCHIALHLEGHRCPQVDLVGLDPLPQPLHRGPEHRLGPGLRGSPGSGAGLGAGVSSRFPTGFRLDFSTAFFPSRSLRRSSSASSTESAWQSSSRAMAYITGEGAFSRRSSLPAASRASRCSRMVIPRSGFGRVRLSTGPFWPRAEPRRSATWSASLRGTQGSTRASVPARARHSSPWSSRLTGRVFGSLTSGSELTFSARRRTASHSGSERFEQACRAQRRTCGRRGTRRSPSSQWIGILHVCGPFMGSVTAAPAAPRALASSASRASGGLLLAPLTAAT